MGTSTASNNKKDENVTKEYKIAKLKKERKKIQDQFLVEKKKHPLSELLKTADKKYNMSYEIFKNCTEHLENLKFNEQPDFDMLDGLFEQALNKLNIDMYDSYDWEKH